MKSLANEVRKLALSAIYSAGSGHPGGVLSCADIVAYLYSEILNKEGPQKDRFVLSKGHSVPAIYAVNAALGRHIKIADLGGFRKINSPLQGHPHVGTTPWIENSTGSLGQGFSVAIGMAIGLRYQKDPSRTYVMLGDGELQEGEVWEGAMCAAHYRLDNLCAIVDYNKMQSDDLNENIMGLEPLRGKWESFNWNTIEIDGHDHSEIKSAFEQAKSYKGRPTIIIAHTIKGKGISFMEGVPAWHGSVKLKPEELRQALQELDTEEDEIQKYLDGTAWKLS
jgi:transketolase